MTTAAERLAEFASGLTFEDIPRPVISEAKQHILDILGISLAASQLPYATMLSALVRQWGGKPESTVLVFGDNVPAPSAVLANGSFSHGLDFDDTHTASIVHVSTGVVPAALAVGEAVRADGKALLTAIIAGYETVTRLGMAAPGKFHDRGYHATPLCGAFAAALTAGKLLGLGPDAMASALGICGSQAAGIQAFLDDGSWTKRLHPGWAGHSGVVAAQLAGLGFKGPHTVLEGRFGLFNTHVGSEHFDPTRLTAGLGTTWETLHISFKPYPCCHFNHAYMDAAQQLMQEHRFRVQDIADLECIVPREEAPIVCEPPELKVAPPTTYAALFSLPYCIAVLLVEGKAGLDEFSETKIRDRRIIEIAGRIRYRVGDVPEFPASLPGWVRVRLQDGRTFEKREPVNRGHPANPMASAEIQAKFRDNASRTLPAARVEAILQMVDHLEDLPRVADLTALCVK
ncbi:MAG: MmgE/PrpD family protein [Nitrospinae bacterium]|nr:MmgE/PrpD family protein [Nitrospinota bacterium]